MKNINKILLILLITSLLLNGTWFWVFRPMWFPTSVNIPNELQINNFCKNEGYLGGYLDSRICGINEVICLYKLSDAMSRVETTCVNWNKEQVFKWNLLNY